eukprot:maker-scaffold_8-snap-gene-6.9-mRNA-1 protein AED:0.00 eAED:0.00 QI:310/1/1/1/1/1/3/92/528
MYELRNISNDTLYDECIPEDLLPKEDGEVVFPEEYFAESTEQNRNFSLIFSTVSICYLLVTFSVYLYIRKYSTYLKGRLIWLISIQVFGSIFLFTYSIREFIGRAEFPCLLLNVVPVLLMNLLMWPFVLRAFLLTIRIKENKFIAQKTFLAQTSKRNLTKIQEILGNPAEESLIGRIFVNSTQMEENPINRKESAVINIASKKASFKSQLSLRDVTPADLNISRDERVIKQEAELDKEISKLKFVSSTKFLLFLSFLHFLVTAGSMLGSQQAWRTVSCLGCHFSGFSAIIFVLLYLIYFVAIFIAFHRLKVEEEDSLGISSELKSLFYCSLPFGIAWVVVSYLDPNDLSDNGEIFWGHLLELGFLVGWTISIPYQAYKAVSMMGMDGVAGNAPSLDEILTGDTGRTYFKAWLQKELKIEYYYFIREVEVWKNNFDLTSIEQRTRHAVTIYVTFLSVGATYQLRVHSGMLALASVFSPGLDTDVRNRTIRKDVFDEVLGSVKRTLGGDLFHRFLRSDMYKKYTGTIDVV